MERYLLYSLKWRFRLGALLLAACCPWTDCLADDSTDTFEDGQLFTALTAEGVEMTFKVISAAERTCAVGGGADWWDGTRTTAVAESTEGVVTIPSTVNGFDVVAIEDEAFYGCGSITEVVIPNTLKQLSGPNSWLMGSFPFWGCGMTQIVIPASVETIGAGCFAGCTRLESIVVDSENPYFDSRGGCNAIIATAGDSLVAACKATVIPGSVTTINYLSFYNISGLQELHIPKSVTKLYESIPSVYEYEAPTVVPLVLNCPDLVSITVDRDNPVFDSRGGCNAIVETASNRLVTGCQTTSVPAW